MCNLTICSTHPSFSIRAAKWVVLFPGAAQQSMTLLPGSGARRNAAKHDAWKQKKNLMCTFSLTIFRT